MSADHSQAHDPQEAAPPPRPIGRLKTRRDFLRVAGLRNKWAAPGLILQAAPYRAPRPPRSAGVGRTGAGSPGEKTDEATIRVGFTVSKKVGNAVQRNRARRRLKAAAAEVLPALAADRTDYVIIGRTATLDRPYGDLLKDLRVALKRVGTRQPGEAKTGQADRT